MQAQETLLLPFFEGKRQFVIPIYQRKYSWTIEQCKQLWNDIVRVTEDEQAGAHFVGSIVDIQQESSLAGGIQQWLVIDGQQRLTTITLLLLALARVADSQHSTEVTPDDIYTSYLINKIGKHEQRYKLQLTQSDREILMKLIDTPDHIHHLSQENNLVANYHFFKECIQQTKLDLYTLYMGIMTKLIVVEIALSKDDNPQLIFESLNSTGVDLSEADLIRNYILMGLSAQNQARLYNDYWYPMEQLFSGTDSIGLFDRFIRDYLTLKQSTIPNIKEVYSSFKTYHRSVSGLTIRTLVQDIYRYAYYFANIALLKESDEEIKAALRDINTLKVEVAYPFLLEVYSDYEQQKLSHADFVAVIRLVESYTFRRAVCGVPSHGLNKVFAALAREIDKADYLESVRAALLMKKGSSRFPSDEEFYGAFVTKDIYNFQRRNYLLNKIENYKHKEFMSVENYTIEHVMPQNKNLPLVWQQELGSNWQDIQDRYLHTIGNLTLTGYNSELSDRSFVEKRTMKGGFDHSPFFLNESIAHREHWDEEAIKQRADILAKHAMQVWPTPQLSPEQLAKLNQQIPKGPLAEIIGPNEHPLLGTVPEDFRVVQTAEKRFYLFRKIDGTWVQYGNGKNPWFAISWDYAREWLQEKSKKNEMPLGVGGKHINSAFLFSDEPKNEPGLQTDDTSTDVTNGKSYTLNDYAHLYGNTRDLFDLLRPRILNLDASVQEEFKKMYIAYKLDTNFVDVEPQKKGLRLTLNMPFGKIDDPKKLCHDLAGKGHYGNGNIDVRLTIAEQLDDAMDLIRQSFVYHLDESM